MALRSRRSGFMQEYFARQKDEEAELAGLVDKVLQHPNTGEI
jgi:hypothetical protein